MSACSLVWFRQDLRVFDNPALYHACQAGSRITAIYIATPKQWLLHQDAKAKIDFWHRNLDCLKQSLAQLNIDLHFFQVDDYTKISQLISQLCQQWQVDKLYFNHEYPINEINRDQQVITACLKINVECLTYHDQLLLPPASVRTKENQPYKVFTPFAKQARNLLQHGVQTYPTPDKQANTLQLFSKLEKNLEQINWPLIDDSITTFWPAGEQQALKRLYAFCQQAIDNYSVQRDIPSLAATSRLSPYLSNGVISIRQCWQVVSTLCEPNDSVFCWQNELLWREFYKQILIENPQLAMHKAYKPLTEKIAWSNNEQQLEAWQQGQTGFPLIDAAMRQLQLRGWMHNRLRMVTAMFLSKQLLMDWRLGESWFMQHLIDGEFAANNGGWQWCASTGTDAVPYFRIFNPVSQSQRFDPKGIFIRHYVPEIAPLSDNELHLPPENKRPQNYPAPMVDLKIARLQALAAFKNLKIEDELF